MFIEVLVELVAKSIDKTFTYSVPKNLIKEIKIGKRVLVPFGNQKLEGFILNIKNDKPDYDTKDIISIIDEDEVLNKEMLEIGKYISKKTLCNLIKCYQTMLPKALKAKNKVNINKKYETYLKIKDLNYKTKNENQNKILKILKKKDELKSVCNNISNYAVKVLLEKKVIEEIKIEQYRLKEEIVKHSDGFKLTEEQQKIVNQIFLSKDNFTPYLLHGVTGSGKTEVYMGLIEKIIKEKQVIVLVPEISLTPQFIEKFKNRFGDNIAVLHSGLSDGERYDEWRKIKKNEVKIVIGARSAVFAPFSNLGLIIIDEEHSQNYKQENNPKYNTIDIAIFRAKHHKCPLLLGSATPSVESYTRAKAGIYKLLELKKRVNTNMPYVNLVDMKEEIKKGNKILSDILVNKINERLQKKEQVLLLLNRRGYTTITTCKKCGFTHNCPRCDIPLIYHKSSNTMRCHYCGYGSIKYLECPNCKSKDIVEYGIGTEKLEQIVKETFINSKVVRMDIDTTTAKGSHKKIINDFMDEKYDILIGTQMISKGLDFPKVTLVGVINADATLNIPDFRSAERTYQLLNQVSGRAGRKDLEGEVVIQAFNIDNYSILYASKHDYLSFYNEELRIRKNLNYPPFCNLSKVEIYGDNYDEVFVEATKISEYLKQEKNINVLGPSTANIPKINNIYHVYIILKYKDTSLIMDKLQFILNKYKQNKKINIDLDINSL